MGNAPPISQSNILLFYYTRSWEIHSNGLGAMIGSTERQECVRENDLRLGYLLL
jgi:hypothetical protein